MITNEAFVLLLGVFLGSLVFWAFKRLPEERWQFVASVPVMKDSSGLWRGINFTYYGLLTANALAFGVALLIVLFGALHINTPVTLALILVLLLICLPSARWVAQLIEGKPCTFTIAGAFFVGNLCDACDDLPPQLDSKPCGIAADTGDSGACRVHNRVRVRRRSGPFGMYQLRLLLWGGASRFPPAAQADV